MGNIKKPFIRHFQNLTIIMSNLFDIKFFVRMDLIGTLVRFLAQCPRKL